MEIIGNVEKDAQVRAVASGALPSGDAVVVNSDGTVSVVAGSDSSSGTPVVFQAQNTPILTSTFDSNSNKVVIAFMDAGNSNYGTAVVGTVSGTSISFGAFVTFLSATFSSLSATFDSSSNKVVLAYTDNSNSQYGTAVVGTVSGTSISFGTPVVFESAGTVDNALAFDSTNNKVVVSYRDEGDSNNNKSAVGAVSGTSISFGTPVTFRAGAVNGLNSVYDVLSGKVVISYWDNSSPNYGQVIVGTVSGTSISFGSQVVFESAYTEQISMAYDSINGKVVIAYRDNGNSSYGTAIVGTVSGNSISFGSAVVFESANVSWISSTYDSNAQKVVISYDDNGNSSKGTIVVGTVSGTSITFEPAIVFEEGNTVRTSSTFDSNSNKVVVSYADDGNSGNGTSAVFSVGSTNLTAENFLGFAAHTYGDTQSALVNSTCTVDRNQTSLTAGQTYYVQTDGSLGTTAANPSVVAGTAISSTEIIVKG